MADRLPYAKARRITGFQVPPDWVPSLEEKLWLEDFENMSKTTERFLDRFSPAADDPLEEVLDEATGEWRKQ